MPFLLTFVLWATAAGTPQTFLLDVKETLSVCEILRDPLRYQGKNVSIRGEWHTDWIEAKCDPVKTGDHVWPTSIWLEIPISNKTGVVFTPVNWSLDQEAYQRALQIKRGARGKQIFATFQGRLDVRDRLEMLTEGYVKPYPNGFGEQNQFPAQLIIRTITDVGIGRQNPE